jgi:tRNA(fMet)-specific endonuclease VapC
MRSLIDTDWVIHHLNGRPDIIQRLQALQHEGLGLSVIVLAELYEGVYYSRDPGQSEQRLNEFLESVALVGVDEETAKIFGRERGRLRAAGMMIGDIDLLIAATALQYDLTLLTNNRNHFERIEGLRIESCSFGRES